MGLGLVLTILLAWRWPGPALPASPTSPTDGLYLADGNASPGAVYRLESDGSLTTYYTRPAGALTHFAFSPAGDLYYADPVGYSIFTSTPDGEQVYFTHDTYVKDLAFGSDGLLYFSDARLSLSGRRPTASSSPLVWGRRRSRPTASSKCWRTSPACLRATPPRRRTAIRWVPSSSPRIISRWK